MQDDFAKYFRCFADDQGWAFEVATIGWEGVYTPVVTWRVFRRWKREPTEASIARARAAALKNRTLFRLCELCDEINTAGHMHSASVCQGCAERHLRVVY